MFRFRRYRVTLVCAVVAVLLVYQANIHRDRRAQLPPLKPAEAQPRQPEQKPLSGGERASVTSPLASPPSDNDTPPTLAIGNSAQHHDDPASVLSPSPATAYQDTHVPANPGHKPVEWFPVPDEAVIRLPAGKPKLIPTIQHQFGPESAADKTKRERRRDLVRAEAAHAWAGYKKYAWMHDEVMPLSNGYKDTFCGWAATLVDSLDTLWIMGLRGEFDEAVRAVAEIDFTNIASTRRDIPMFETTIRYLGGLLGAYDVAGGHKGASQNAVLLAKAVELADVLMGAFDRPNRMPILYYHQWQPGSSDSPQVASSRANVAELGTLSMEFTHLAQLTGEHRYYDAVARITDALEEFQGRGREEGGSGIPGIFPEKIDASGCGYTDPVDDTAASSGHSISEDATLGNSDPKPLAPGGARGLPQPRGAAAGTPEFPPNWQCRPKNLTTAGSKLNTYSMGGCQDSVYEYMPKQFLLLGGLEGKYRTMHEKVVAAVKKYLLFRPMSEGDPDVLFSAKLTEKYSGSGYALNMNSRAADDRDHRDSRFTVEHEITHLTCFLGGMFGLSGKLLGSAEDLEIAGRLTEGCVWAYGLQPSGLMPEVAQVMACADPPAHCRWNESAWHDRLDPDWEERYDREMIDYASRHAVWEEQISILEWEEEEPESKRKDKEVAVADEMEEEEAWAPRPSSDLKERDLAIQQQTHSSSVIHRRHNGPVAPDGDDVPRPKKRPQEPTRPQTHLEYVEQHIANRSLPPGFLRIGSRHYILRPEAIESVWYMYRITGDRSWQEKGWRMFEAVVAATRSPTAHAAVRDVTMPTRQLRSQQQQGGEDPPPDNTAGLMNSMESFWLAETLKYFYLLFETPDVISLDEWVLNTEAHPFKRPS